MARSTVHKMQVLVAFSDSIVRGLTWGTKALPGRSHRICFSV